MDPFDLLGIPPAFEIDAPRLELAYLERSASLHPDLARGDADAARLMAALNDARRVLADPERRADALLLRLGGPARDQERGLPEGFLIEMMETREAIEAAVNTPDPAQRDAARARWETWAEDRRREAVAMVAALFAALPDPPTPDSLRAIRVRLNAWRYIERLIEQLDPEYNPKRADFPEP